MRNPLSLPAFLAWVEKQPARTGYNFEDAYNCAICRFLKSAGVHEPQVLYTEWAELGGGWKDIPQPVVDSVRSKPHTFTSLAKRLRAQVAQ